MLALLCFVHVHVYMCASAFAGLPFTSASALQMQYSCSLAVAEPRKALQVALNTLFSYPEAGGYTTAIGGAVGAAPPASVAAAGGARV